MRTRYHPAARWLHWISAAAVLATIPVALTMTRIDDGAPKNALYEIHKSVGIVVFILAGIRICARLVLQPPPQIASLSSGQRIGSAATHHLLYVLLFAVPSLGYLGTAMCCAPVMLFWSVPLPTILEGPDALAELILNLHTLSSYLMTALIAVHIAGALYHYAVRRDGVMARISLWGR